jgi:hypothetical protein
MLCDVFWRETMRISSSVSPNLAEVLKQLAQLYIVYWALEKSGDLLVVRFIIISLKTV